MKVTRRDFFAASAACACSFAAGCAAVNPAPLFEALDGSLATPEAIASPGTQIKVKLAGDTVVAWRGADGVVMAASILCTHLGSEVSWNPSRGSLDCPSHGSRFHLDGSILAGPAKRPLRAYQVVEENGRLKLS